MSPPVNKPLFLSKVLLLGTVVAGLGCQDGLLDRLVGYKTNRAPEITTITSQPVTTDNSSGNDAINPGDAFDITVQARDPEGGPLRVRLTSDVGSFSDIERTGNSYTARFTAPDTMPAGFGLSMTAFATDENGVSTTRSYELGTARVGVGISAQFDLAYMQDGQTSNIEWSGDADGYYQLQFLTGGQTTCNVQEEAGFQYYTAGDSGTVTICTPSATECIGDEFRIPVLNERVLFCLIIRDRLGQDAIFTTEFAADSIPPTASIGPAGLNGSVVEDPDGVSVTFNCSDNFSCQRFRYAVGKDAIPADPSFGGTGQTVNATTGDNPETGTATVVAGGDGDGVYTLKMIAQDEAGLVSNVRQVEFTVDTDGDPAPPTFTVTYNGNGNTSGTAPVDNNDYTSGQSVTVLGQNTLARATFEFAGWNTASDGSGQNYSQGNSFTIGSANVTLFAKWLGTLGGSIVDGAGGSSEFNDIVVDESGNSYVVGDQTSQTNFDYGFGVNLAGASNGRNAVLIKYNSAGNPEWGITTFSAPFSAHSSFQAVDYSDGRVCVAGFQENNNSFTYLDAGGSITPALNGGYSGNNGIVICFDDDGNHLWGRTTTIASSTSTFYGIAIDNSGFVYAAGIAGSSSVIFSGSAGNVDLGGSASQNGTIIRLNPTSGLAEWGDTVQPAVNAISFYLDVAYNPVNDVVLAAGYQFGTNSFSYGGNSLPASAISSGQNAVAVRYRTNNPDVEFVFNASAGPTTTHSSFSAVDCNANGFCFLAGSQQGNSSYDWGGETVTGPHTGPNPLLLRIDNGPSISPQWGRSTTGGSGDGLWDGVSADANGGVYVAGVLEGGAGHQFSPSLSLLPAGTTSQGGVVRYNSTGTATWGKTVNSVPDPSHPTRYRSVHTGTFGRVNVVGRQRGASGVFDHGGFGLSGSSTAENSILLRYQGN